MKCEDRRVPQIVVGTLFKEKFRNARDLTFRMMLNRIATGCYGIELQKLPDNRFHPISQDAQTSGEENLNVLAWVVVLRCNELEAMIKSDWSVARGRYDSVVARVYAAQDLKFGIPEGEVGSRFCVAAQIS